jgi:hypothetical protein
MEFENIVKTSRNLEPNARLAKVAAAQKYMDHRIN